MLSVLWIAAGGALGAVARFGVSRLTFALLGTSFPYSTLFVNAFGSLLAGGLVVLCTERWPASQILYAFGIVGVLGAFTTFSAFSIDTLALLQAGYLAKALINICLNLGLSLSFCAIGMHLMR